jgi:hypothetical protein
MLVDVPATLRRRGGIVGGAALVVAAVASVLVPTFSLERPQRVNVVFRQDEERARVFVDTAWGRATWGKAPSVMLNAIGGPVAMDSALLWNAPSSYVETPRVDLAAPVAEVVAVDESHRRSRVRLRSQRGAETLVLLLPADRRIDFKIDGHFAMPRSVIGGRALIFHAVPKEGVVVDVEVADASLPITYTLFDRSRGVPQGTKADDAVRVRPSNSTSFQDGDQTIVSRVVSF